MQLSAIDLNQLVILDALLETCSVKRASAKVGRSPSATSHALARLRELFDDPLLVRAGRKLVPTPKALGLRSELARLLAGLETLLLAEEHVDPSRARRSFRVGTTDYAELLLIAPLSSRLASSAPQIDLVGVPHGSEVVEQLRQGDVELLIGVFSGLPDDIRVEPLWDDRFVCLLRAEHPLVRGRRRLTLERFTELEHVLVAPRGQPRGIVDQLLAERGQRRRVARSVASFVAAPHLVAGGDYVLTISERIAQVVAESLGLIKRDPPLELVPYTVSLCWQRRFDDDGVHRWLREQLIAIAREADEHRGRPGARSRDPLGRGQSVD